MTSFCLWFQTSAIFLYLPDQKTLANMHIVTHLSCGLIKQIISSNVGGYRGMKAWYKPVEYTPLSTCIPLALCNHLTRKLSALPDPSNCISRIKTPIGNLRYGDRFSSLWQSPEDDLHLGLPFGYSTRVSHVLICRTSRHANDGNLIKKLKWNWQGYLLKTPGIHMWNALSQGNQMLATAKVDIAALFAQVKIHGSSSHPDICVETSKNHLWSNSACI